MSNQKIIIKERNIDRAMRFYAMLGKQKLANEGWEEDNKIRLEDVNLKHLLKVLPTQIEGELIFMPYKDLMIKGIQFKVKLLYVEISKKNIKITLSLWMFDFFRNLPFNSYKYLKVLSKLSRNHNFKVDTTMLDHGSDDANITLQYSSAFQQNVKGHLKIVTDKFLDLHLDAYKSLRLFKWKKVYETNELRFSKEILWGLFKQMQFNSVVFNHGNNEFGKDFTFSTVDEFGVIRNFGIQVKAGDVNGRVNSKINELIDQAKDAFSNPYTSLDSKTRQYISTFIIVISGRFTHNAKEKIIEKLDKGIKGSVYFFDKEKVTDLISKYY